MRNQKCRTSFVSTMSRTYSALHIIAAANPDIILLDVMMPYVSGPELLQHLRATKELRHIPVVFMTARVQPKEVKEYLRMGATAVVHKPFDPMQLSAQIEEILLQGSE
jgi:CheY-like chemotaxis protein